MKNRLCRLLGIEIPIVQGAMQWLSVPELAAEVSNAGGLGIITAATFPEEGELARQIRRMKQMTDKPFAVNISLLPGRANTEKANAYIDAVIAEGAPIVETSGRNPEDLIDRLKSNGIVVMHKVPSVRFAQKAEQIGVDAVTVVSYESGGHPGMGEATSMIQIRKAAGELRIPLIAGGGITDGAAMAAALALGADGVVMGTRFIASLECPIHPAFKQLIVDSSENDTVLIMRSIKNVLRARENATTRAVLEMEKNKAPLEELLTRVGGAITRTCYQAGDTEGCAFPIGQSAGLISDIEPAGAIVRRTMREAQEVLRSLSAGCAPT
jgi:nitronate monooxygenase